jgi:hypothetical protein
MFRKLFKRKHLSDITKDSKGKCSRKGIDINNDGENEKTKTKPIIYFSTDKGKYVYANVPDTLNIVTNTEYNNHTSIKSYPLDKHKANSLYSKYSDQSSLYSSLEDDYKDIEDDYKDIDDVYDCYFYENNDNDDYSDYINDDYSDSNYIIDDEINKEYRGKMMCLNNNDNHTNMKNDIQHYRGDNCDYISQNFWYDKHNGIYHLNNKYDGYAESLYSNL